MPSVPVHLPAPLHSVAGAKRLRVEAATLQGALDAAFAAVPALRYHLCDDAGKLRMHVLCFLNDRNTREMATLDVPLADGDEITFVPAISGG